MRILKLALGLLAVLVIGLFLARNPLIKWSVTNVGSKIVGVEIGLDGVEFSPFSGRLALHGLSVGNPAGFEAKNAISVGDIEVVLKPKSLLTNTIQISAIKIAEPQITVEGGLNKNNLTALQKQLAGNPAAAAPKASKEAAPAEQKTAGQSKKVVIDLVQIKDGKVNVVKPLEMTANLGTLTLRDIGKGSDGGMDIAGFVNLLLNRVLQAAGTVATGELGKAGQKVLDDANGELNKHINDFTGKLKGVFGK